MKIKLAQYILIAAMSTGLLLASVIIGTAEVSAPDDPDTFLTMLERNQDENATTATAYYAAVDPLGKKTTYKGWLAATGIIADEDDYMTTGDFPVNPDAITVVHQKCGRSGFCSASDHSL